MKAAAPTLFSSIVTLTISILLPLQMLRAQDIPQPLLYLDFEGATIEDRSTNAQALTFHGSINAASNTAAGAPGGATPSTGLQLTGGGVIKTPIAVQNQLESYTLSAWIRPTSASLSGDRFFWGQQTRGIHNGLRNNGRLHEAHWGNDWYANTILTADQWVHAVFTYDGLQDNTDNTGTGRIYLNGSFDGEKVGNHGRPNDPSNLLIGGRQGNTNGGNGEHHFLGDVDDMIVWDRVLTEEQISALADGVSPVAVSDDDEDNLPDWWENKYAGNLTSLSGLAGDFDEDGLTDYDEFEIGTDPTEEDTDGDGLEDNVETNTGAFVSESDTGTDPKNADTDGDDLNDSVETNTGIFVNAADTGTDPHLADTDGDGSSDGFEVNNGTNPTDGNDSPDSWLVRNAQSGSALNSIADTRALFDGLGNLINETTTSHRTINFRENANGPFPNAEAFPLIGVENGDTNDYAIKATGTIFIAEPGTYTFGFNSDDGGGLWIDGNPVVVADVNRGSSTSVGAVELSPGNHEVEFLYWERGGGAQVQLFVHNQLGDFSAAVPDNNLVLSDYSLLETSVASDADDDGDLLPDWWENLYANNLTSLNGLDGSDFDEDGLTDFDEFEISTDPTEEDTDADGLEDNVETNTGTFVSVSDTGTDPLKADTDSDGLNDGQEVFVHETNPHIADSDGDGFTDGSEISAGTDPNNEDSAPDLVVIDLSFPPLIGGPGAGQDAYEPNLEESGLSFQENHYGAGVLTHDNTDQNYDRVVLNPENWTPARSKTQVEPYFDHGNGGFTTPSGGNRPWIDGGGDDFSVRINGYMLLKQTGTYTIHLGGDDTNYFVIDTPDGAVNVKHNCCPQDTQGTFTVTAPGYYPFDNLFCERGGGDWGDVSISGPGIPQRVALGDVAAGSPKIFTIKFNDADTDGDLLPDWWENTYANSLDALSGLDDSDLDGDTLTDFDEYENGTNPNNEDTDGDGLEDNVETNTGTFVSASDTGTDPNKADTDNDGLNDGVESNSGVFAGAADTGTDPHAKDSDSDGFSDGAEVDAGTNPVNTNDFPASLLLYFDFEGDAGTTVTDKADSSHDGTFNGNVSLVAEGAPAGASPGAAAQLTGGFINVPGIDMNTMIRDFGSGSYTMTCWLKPSDITGEKFVFGQTDTGIHNGIRNNSYLHQAHWSSDTNGATQLGPYIAADEDGWIHAAFVYDGDADQGTIYLDGQQDWAGQKNAPNGGGNMIIGARNNGELPYQGLIDEVAVWTSALTAEQILALAEGDSPLGGSPTPLEITNITTTFSPGASPVVTLSFNSKAGKIYAVDRTVDLLLWEELDDGLEGEADSTEFTDSFLPEDSKVMFYRVRQVE